MYLCGLVFGDECVRTVMEKCTSGVVFWYCCACTAIVKCMRDVAFLVLSSHCNREIHEKPRCFGGGGGGGQKRHKSNRSQKPEKSHRSHGGEKKIIIKKTKNKSPSMKTIQGFTAKIERYFLHL